MPNENIRPAWFTVSTETASTVGVESVPGVSVNYSEMRDSGYLEWRVAPDPEKNLSGLE